MNRRRLLIVASQFPPARAAGVYRTLRFARYLPELGWDIDVLTIDPRFYEKRGAVDPSLVERLPSAVRVHGTRAVYPIKWLKAARLKLSRRGAKPRTQSFHSPGESQVELDRTTMWQSVKDALTLPLMTPDRCVGWIPFAVAQGRRIIRTSRPTVLYSSGPPWSNHLVGLRLVRQYGLPWIADFRDPWVGSDYRPQRRDDTWVGRRHRQLERNVVTHASMIVLNTIRSRDEMRSRYPDVDSRRFRVLTNGFDPADYDASWTANGGFDTRQPPRTVFTIAHAGAFYGRRTVEPLITALAEACRSGEIPRERIRLELIGALRPGRDRERRLVHEAGLEGVVSVLPSVPHSECLRCLAQADALLLVQTDAPLCIPGKVFEYIAIGKPILALTGEGATRDLVETESLGVCLDPAAPRETRRCLIDLWRRWARGESLPAPNATTRHSFDGRRLTQSLHDMLLESIALRSDALISLVS